MIDRNPRTEPMTRWPDWKAASPRVICAPISAMLNSPRCSQFDGRGMAFSMKVNRERERERMKRRGGKPPRGGKHQ